MNDRRYSYEPRSSARAREAAQWDELKARVSPLVAAGDSWSLLQASRIADSASRTMSGKPPADPAPPPEGGYLSSLSKLLEGGADTFRRVVPQGVRDVVGGGLQALTSGERALNAINDYSPGNIAGRAIGDYISGGESTRYQQERGLDKPGTYLRNQLERAPGGGFLAQVADIAFAPATLLTAGVGGEATAALKGGGLASRALGAAISPVAPEGVGFAGRLAAETAAGVGGGIGTEKANEYAQAHDFGTAGTLGINLLGGLVGGAAGAGLAGVGRAVKANAVRPQMPDLASEAGSMRLRAGEPPAPRTAKALDLGADFERAVQNTPGAAISDRGLELDISRFQHPDQAGETSLRTGVFFMPEANSPYARHYRVGPRTSADKLVTYGGVQRIDERAVMENPLVVKASTGGRAPQLAYDQLKGKGAYEAMRSEVLDSIQPISRVWGGNKLSFNEKSTIVRGVLEKFGADSTIADAITQNAVTGNQLPYAIQEAIVAQAVRDAGHDSVVSFNKLKGDMRLTEVFDVDTFNYPDPKQIEARGTYAPPPVPPAVDAWDEKWPLNPPHERTGWEEPIDTVSVGDRTIRLNSYGDAVGDRGYNGGFTALDDATGERLGAIEYQYHPDSPDVQIAWVQVDPGNKGVSDALLKRLQTEFPDKPLNPGMQTPDGARWWNRVGGEVERYRATVLNAKPISGGAGAQGVAPPPALTTVFGVQEPTQGLSRWERGLNAIKRTLGEPAEMVVDDPIATPAAREQKRALQRVASVAASESRETRMLVENAGFKLDDQNRIPALTNKGSVPGAPTLQDVAARLPEYAMYLTPEQSQAMNRLRKLMEPYDQVVAQTAGQLSSREDVMPGGFYLHRAFEQKPVTRVTVGGGKIGGKQGFEKEAGFNSMAEAIDAGKVALSPWDAVGEYVKQVGEGGVNQYFADYMKSLIDPATGKHYAMTSADRIDPKLKADVESLRAKIAARRATLQGQAARGTAAERELRRAERATQEAGARVVGAQGRRALMPDVTPEDLAAAREDVRASIEEARALGREIGASAEQLRNTRNGLSAAERAVVAEADRLDETLAQADAFARGAEKARPGNLASELVTPDTTIQKVVDSGATREQIESRIAELQKGVDRNVGEETITASQSAANSQRLKEIGELQALADIVGHIRAGGTIAELEPLVEDAARAVEVQGDAGMRARASNAARDARKRGGFAKTGFTSRTGIGDDLDSLRARADVLFHVWDQGTLEAPVPDFTASVASNAQRTAEAKARQGLKAEGARSLDREHRLALREAERVRVVVDRLTSEAEKMATRLDQATERGAILGDLDRASRQQIVESRRAERLAVAGDRRIAQADRDIKLLERDEARAARAQAGAESRALTASARAGQTGSELAQAQADLDSIKAAWEHTKALSRQTPEERGTIGLAELQGTDFPLSMANAANSVLNSEAPPSGKLTSSLKAIAAVNNVLRGAHATLDASFMGIQGAIGAANDPVAFRRAMGAVWQGLSDKNAAAGVVGMFDQNAQLRGTLSSRELAALGLQQAGADTEFTLRTGLLDRLTKAPGGQAVGVLKSGIEKSNEAFGTFGDMMRLYHADNLISKALAKGDVSPNAIARFRTAGIIDPQLKAIIDHTNLVTGWSPSKFGGSLGDVLQFAPRFFQSQLELAANALTKWGPDHLEGKLARRELLQYMGLAVGATVLINGMQGKTTELNPFGENSSNFMRIRAGGRDYSLLGPWDSLLRVFTAGVKGVAEGKPLEGAQYLARTKASPVVQVAWDLLAGEDFKGTDLRSPTGLAEWLAKQVTPFSMQDLPSEASQATTNPLGAAAGAVSGFLGVKSSPMTPNEQLDAVANELAPGKGFWELEPYQRQALKEQNPDLWKKSVENGSDARQRAEAVRGDYYAKQQQADDNLTGGALTKQAWRDMRDTFRIEQRAKLEEIYGDSSQRKGAPRNAYERYLRIIDENIDPKTGQPVWDRVDAGLADLPASDQAEIEKSVGVGQTPLSREYARAQKEYAKLPIYQGYTADQAREIDAQWQEIRNAAGDSQLAQLRAVGRLGDEVDDVVKKALRRRALGNSLKDAPDRKAYKKANPRFAALSGNGKLTEAERQALGISKEAA